MREFKVCTAIRDKEYEDRLIEIINNQGWKHSYVNIDDIVNEHRRGSLFFIIEDSYTSILDLIELHNSCHLNFLPVVILSSADSRYYSWADHVRSPEKYFRISMEVFQSAAVQIIKTMSSLMSSYQHRKIYKFRKFVSDSFADHSAFRDFLNTVLQRMLELLYAERGSIMLLNEKGNLVIEASTKKNLVGLEVEPKPDSVAWTVMNTKEPVFVENIEHDQRFKKAGGYAKDYFMSLPIFVNGKIEGVFNLSDKIVALLFDMFDKKNANNLLDVMEPYFYIEKLNKCMNALSKIK